MDKSRKIEEMKEFDLFKLHIPAEDKSARFWIRAKGANLPKTLNIYMRKILQNLNISTNQLAKLLSDKLGFSIGRAHHFLYSIRDTKNIWIPLPIILEILDLANINNLQTRTLIQSKFEYLKTANNLSKPIKPLFSLTETVCKLAGAHAADGSLTLEINKRGYKIYHFDIGDEHFSSVNLFRRWIHEAFGLRLNIRKRSDKEFYVISIKNKIFFRYLNIFLGFPIGAKTYITRMPKIIRSASFDYRKAFVIGAFTFEVAVCAEGATAFRVTSKSFAEDVANTLKSANINLKLCEEKSGFWSFKLNLISENANRKILDFFEQGTDKYHKVKGFLYGFDGKVSNIDDAIHILNKTFGRSVNICRLSNVLVALNSEPIDHYALKQKVEQNLATQVSERTLRAKLRVLCLMNCIKQIKRNEVVQLKSIDHLDRNTRLLLEKELLDKIFKQIGYSFGGKEKSTLNNWRFGKRGIPKEFINQLISNKVVDKREVINNILCVTKRDLFVYNPNISEWRLPSIEQFQTPLPGAPA